MQFEILSDLQKTDKYLGTDTIPQLRLAPPAIYHEKIQQRPGSLIGEPSDSSLKNEKPNKRWQLKELKSRGSLNMFPLKSNIFGKSLFSLITLLQQLHTFVNVLSAFCRS